MPTSCRNIRALLAECLQESDCIMVDRHRAHDCIRPPLFDTLPTRCQQLKRAYTECRRGLLDMRKRFRGNQPVGVSRELEGAGGGHQLYAGRPAISQQGQTDGLDDGKEE